MSQTVFKGDGTRKENLLQVGLPPPLNPPPPMEWNEQGKQGKVEGRVTSSFPACKIGCFEAPWDVSRGYKNHLERRLTMETLIQPRFSMTEDEVEEMVGFLETLPPEEGEGKGCDMCLGRFCQGSSANEFYGVNIFDRESGELIEVCDKCFHNLNKSKYVVEPEWAETLEEALEMGKEKKRKLEVIKKAKQVLLKEGFDFKDFTMVPY